MTQNPSDHGGQTVLSPDELKPMTDAARRVLRAMDEVLLGQEALHEMVFAGILSRGHILLEGMPGLGKTTLIQALGDLLGLEFRRVQFTPDLMPSDIVGSTILQQGEGGDRRMEFRPGPVFTNILLADEINRASPKTQSALLEAMQERRVTTLGETRKLPSPFFVLASQNPVELEGTYPLPEAQLDRFLFKLQVGLPQEATLERIISTRRRGEPPRLEPVADPQQIDALLNCIERIVLPPAVARYTARLVNATHPTSDAAPDHIQRFVKHGASPRAAIGIAEAARAHALLAGRPTAGFEDVRAVAPHVLNHRIILNHDAGFERIDAFDVVRDLIKAIDPVRLDLPSGVRLEAEEPTR